MRIKKFAAVVLACAPALALTACSKPSEDEVHKAVVKMMEEDGTLTAEQAEQYADCATPKMMDQISRSGLNNIVEDGIDAKGTDEDVTKMTDIATECSKEITG